MVRFLVFIKGQNTIHSTMKKLTFLFFLGLTVISCQDDPTLCGLPDDSTPAWMDALIEQSSDSALASYFYFETAELDGAQVFIANNCCPNCGTIIQVYNCQGEVIGSLGDDISQSELDNLRLFWAPENFQCNVASAKSPQ